MNDYDFGFEYDGQMENSWEGDYDNKTEVEHSAGFGCDLGERHEGFCVYNGKSTF